MSCNERHALLLADGNGRTGRLWKFLYIGPD